ncbi:MAG: hypothetical protein K6F00_02360 [Lachnospiraceae bacterium]|nr:hypothetical protein [Lachnospiraceae bacterium]
MSRFSENYETEDLLIGDQVVEVAKKKPPTRAQIESAGRTLKEMKKIREEGGNTDGR